MSRLAALFTDADWLTPERVRRVAVVMLVFAVGLFAADVGLHTRYGVVDATGEQLGRDFVNYWAGARAAAAGHADLAYRVQDFLAYERGLTAPNAEFKIYSYPPAAMLLSLPVGVLPYVPAFLLWTLLGTIAAAALLSARLGWGWALIATVATPAFLLNAVAGQNGAFSAALLAGGVLMLPRRPLTAGLLFGLLCYKPQLGLLVPVALVASGRWRTAFAAAVTVAAVVLASTALFGADAWIGFIHALPLHRALLEQDRLIWHRIPTVFVAVRWLGGGSALGYAVQAASSLAAAAVVFAVWRGRVSMRLKGGVLLVATFLATPYAWDYDMVMLTAAACWFWQEAATDGWRPWEKTVLVLMVVAPALTPAIAVTSHLHLGPVVLWWMLGLMARRALAPADRTVQAVDRRGTSAERPAVETV